MRLKIAAVIVLYNPDETISENISSYIDSVDTLYAVDNSEDINTVLVNKLQQHPKINYIDNNGNQGIAHALNIGMLEAQKAQYDYLLTMDQDSRFNPGDFKILLGSLEHDNLQIGIYAPLSFDEELEVSPFSDKVSITSGSIFNLNVCKKVGTFNDDLFIDSVDTEYCLRMHQKGFQLKRVKSVVLDHKLGDIREFKFLSWKFSPTNHSALRRYYITRNRFYIWKKFKNDYPEFVRFEQISTIKEIIKILLAEDNKFDKLKMSIRGYLDYRKKIVGKYAHP